MFNKKNIKFIIQLSLIFLISSIFFYTLQFSNENLSGKDGYYHIKYSYLLRTEGLSRDFEWWQASVFKDHFSDEYLIYHSLLIPFTYNDLIRGAKFSVVFFSALMLTILFFVLKKLKVKFPIFWTFLVPLSSSSFLFRMSFTRAIVLSISLLFLYYYFIRKKYYIGQFLIAFIFVWSFPAFYLPYLILLPHLLGYYVEKKQFEKKAAYITILGTFVGLIINPYFPNNIIIAYVHNFKMLFNGILGNFWGRAIETAPPKLSYLIEHSFLPFIIFITSIILIFFIKNKKKCILIESVLIGSIFLVMSFIMRRGIDYGAPFAIFFSAIIISYFLSDKKINFKVLIKNSKIKSLFFIILLLIIIISSINNFTTTKKDMETYIGDSYRFQECADWLESNTPKDSNVYHNSWDVFPELFFFNHHNRYMVGLTTDFMRSYDQILTESWRVIQSGTVDHPGYLINKIFNSSYIFADPRDVKFEEKLDSDPRVTQELRTNSCRIYSIKLKEGE